jgi:hypothetical protein
VKTFDFDLFFLEMVIWVSNIWHEVLRDELNRYRNWGWGSCGIPISGSSDGDGLTSLE